MTGSGPVSVVILFARKCKPNSAPCIPIQSKSCPLGDASECSAFWSAKPDRIGGSFL